VTAKVVESPKVPSIEQILPAAAATENVMVAAFALGLGRARRTGEAAYDPEIKGAFARPPRDANVGFLYLGRHTSPPSPPPTLDRAGYVVAWDEQAPA
jgi:nitroreductase